MGGQDPDWSISRKNFFLPNTHHIYFLHEGLEKVELSLDGMKATFNKPLTPDDAIDAFRSYIDQVAKGKERDKIRIILK